jgi:hypothetical protein
MIEKFLYDTVAPRHQAMTVGARRGFARGLVSTAASRLIE